MRTIALILAIGIVSGPALARQPVEIVGTFPEDGQSGVPLETSVTFRLSKPLPPFGSLFTRKFSWSPVPSAKLWGLGHDFDENRELTIAFFTLEHAPATDFSFWVYGVRAHDGSLMERPFALNYTTGPEHGSLTVSGSVAFGERVAGKKSSAWEELAEGVRQILADNAQAVDAALSSAGSRDPVAASGGGPPGGLPPLQARTRQADDLGRTVVLLLQHYTLDGKRWRVRSAAVPDESGHFTLNHVSPGTYWPVALNYATEHGEEIGSFGFFDATGDFNPDPVTVGEDGLSGIHLSLFSLEPVTASSFLELAAHRARAETEQPVLMEIAAAEVDADGKSGQWRYVFRNQEAESRLVVDVDPLSIRFARGSAPPAYGARLNMPAAFLDSDEALAIAEAHGGSAFRAAHEDATVSMAAGDLDLDERPPAGTAFWHVDYRGTTERLSVFVDVESGELLRPVSAEQDPRVPAGFSLAQNYPNPFHPSTSITFTLPATRHVRITVYDLLGREVAVLADETLAPGAHTVSLDAPRLPPGTYLYRMEAGDFVRMRKMQLVR